jgi:hypothetical protein
MKTACQKDQGLIGGLELSTFWKKVKVELIKDGQWTGYGGTCL